MAHRNRIHRTGGPEVLQYEDYDVNEPGPGQVRLIQQAAGVDFAIGDRVAYWLAFGSHADARLIDADQLVKLPT